MAERLAHLAARLTARDVWLCQLLDKHHVLTTTQLTDLAFPNLDTAQHRLVIPHRLGVLERFRPRRDRGSAPYHYVLGPTGTRVLAARRGQDPSRVRYRRDDALAVAHWQHLEHLVAVTGSSARWAAPAGTRPDRALVAWRSERRCAARWGRLVRPDDGYGRWRDADAEVDFFVEVDRATEPAWRLADKLDGYATLATVTRGGHPGAVLVPDPQREATARAALGTSAIPVATAAATNRGSRSPAEPVWLWLGSSAPRVPLAALAHHHSTP